MTREEKQQMLYSYCGNTDCRDCKMVKDSWEHQHDNISHCLLIRAASDEELDEALHLIGAKEPPAASAAPKSAWISVKDRLPDEHDSFFAKLIDAGKGNPAMFRKTSDVVIISGHYPDGQKFVSTGATHDGEWFITSIYQKTVTHWTPMPEPPDESEK